MRDQRWAVGLMVGFLGFTSQMASAMPAEARGQAAERQAVAQHVERTERELIAAITARDLATYDRLVADDYVALTVEGTETTKQAMMAGYKAGTRRYSDLALHDVKVRVFSDDAAVVSARTTGSRIEGGKAVPNIVRYIRMYALREGRWRAVMQMAAPLPSK